MDKPQFKLARVFEDGTQQDVAVLPVTSLGLDVKMGRRGLLGTGVAMSSIVASLAGCGHGRKAAHVPATPNPIQEGTSGPLKAHLNTVTGLSLAPDGKSLLSGGLDEGIKEWSFPAGEYRSPFASSGQNKTGFSAFLLTPDGQKLVSEIHDPLSSEIEVKNYPRGDTVATLTGHTAPVTSLASSPDSAFVASGSGDHTARWWSLDQGRLLATFQGHSDTVTALQISPDGETLYSGSLDGSVRLWSLSQRRFLRRLEPTGPPILVLALSPDGRMLAAGSNDGSIRLWSVPDGALQWNRTPHRLAVNAVHFTRTGTTLISGSQDESVQRTFVNNGAYDSPIYPGVGEITTIHQSPDGLWLIIGTVLGVLVFWDLIRSRIRTYLFDRSINISTVQGNVYRVFDADLGRELIFTLPCGAALPPHAVCTCNCVGGEKPAPVVYHPPSCGCVSDYPVRPSCSCVSNYQCTCVPQSVCKCNQVCVCIPQCICQAVPQ